MANIDIQKKSGSSAWLWILALIILALVVWFIAAEWNEGYDYGAGEGAAYESVYDEPVGYVVIGARG